MALARQLPALAPAFPEGVDPDALGASHHRVLGLEVLPYAPVFLAEDGLLRDPVHDHVGAVLRAVAEGRPDALETALRVLPPFVLAVRDAGDPGWALVAELALELAISEGQPPTDWTPAGTLPSLSAADTDLHAISDALVRPACSGWFPTLRALGRVSAAAEVPGGFGPRANRLFTTMLAAVDAGRLPALIGGLGVELERWDEGLAELGRIGAPVGPWRERLAQTRAWVQSIAALSAP